MPDEHPYEPEPTMAEVSADALMVKRVQLEWSSWAIHNMVSREFLDMEFKAACEISFDQMLFRLKKDILTDTFAEDTYSATLNIPETWWQHWKFDHIGSWYVPEWWLDRYPVRYRTETAHVHVKRMHTYPEATFARDDRFGRSFIVETVEPPRWF